MRRWISVLMTALMMVALLAPSAAATGETPPQVTLELSRNTVAAGDRVELRIKITGVSNLYGYSADVYFDTSVLSPMLPSSMDPSVKTSANGLVTQGAAAPGSFVAYPSKLDNIEDRQSLLAVRVGLQPGATSTGTALLGTLEFMAMDDGIQNFRLADSATATASYAIAPVVVKLVAADGTPITPAKGPDVTLVVGGAVPVTIDSPFADTVFESGNVSVAGTAIPDSAVTVTVGTQTRNVIADMYGEFTAAFTGLADGRYEVKAASGGWTTAPVPIWVDTLYPVVTINPLVPTSPLLVTGTFTDANIDQIYVQVNEPWTPGADDEALITLPTTGTTGTYEKLVNLTSSSSGVYTIRVSAVDKAGRWAQPVQLVVSYKVPLMDLKPRYQPGKDYVRAGDQLVLDAFIGNAPSNLHAYTAEFVLNPDHFTLPADIAGAVSFEDPVITPALTEINAYERDDGLVHLRVNVTGHTGPNPGKTLAFTLRLPVNSAAPAGQSAIWFEEWTPEETGGDGVLFLDGSLEPQTISDGGGTGTEVEIKRLGSLKGKAYLLGRNDYSTTLGNASGIKAIVMSDTTVIATSPATLADGIFMVPDLPETGLGETYTVIVDADSFLSMKITGVTISNGQELDLTHMAGSLWLTPGNIVDRTDSKDVVFLEDLSRVARAWATTPGMPGWDTLSDLDGNGYVDGEDVATLAINWGKRGSMAKVPSAGMEIPYAPLP